MTTKFKQRIIAAIKENRSKYSSDAQQARVLGINAAQLSRINQGDTDQVLSEAKWIHVARKLDVSLNDQAKWITAKTPVFDFINQQLEQCQYNSLSGLMCDIADIGKTYSAKCYVKQHTNAVYIDCSQVKSKQKLVRKIAQEFGVGYHGRYTDVYGDLVYYLRSIPTPLIILDEAGDLDYPAFLIVTGKQSM